MEQIKQEIINNVYENGEQLITGPILQEVLLDMVDDYNGKVSSGSVPADLVEKTGSWDSASNWITENSGNLATKEEIPDTSGLATTESLNSLSSSVAEDFANLDIPSIEGLATTESLNQLSESVAESIPDISGLATTQSVEEATASVKDWVVGQHYLTTASLSGSVTEETVGFMINDATASVKEWVENKNYVTSESLDGYATEDWVQEQGYLTEHQDISGLATTESVNQLSESVAQAIDSLDIPDVSGLATTASVTSLSESVATDITSLSESIAAITGSDLSGYVTTASYLVDSASFDERINSISGSDLSGYATTESLNQLSSSIASDFESTSASIADVAASIPDTSDFVTSGDLTSFSESVASDFENLDIPDISGLATTESLNQVSSSLSASIAAITGSDVDLSGYVTTSSYNVDSASFDDRINTAREEAAAAISEAYLLNSASIVNLKEQVDNIPVVDPSEYVTTQSFNTVSASFDERIDAIDVPDVSIYATTSSVTSLSESVANDFANLNIPDVSGYATTQSVNDLSSSVGTISSSFATTIENINIPDVSIYATTASLNSVSESLSASIAAITGSEVDLSGYATTESLNEATAELSGRIDNWDAVREVFEQAGVLTYYGEDPVVYESHAALKSDLDEYATTSSLNSVSESLSASIAAITSSGGGSDTELREYLFGITSSTVSSLNCSVTYLYCSQSTNATLGFSTVPEDGHSIAIDVFNSATQSINISIPTTAFVGESNYKVTTNGIDYISPYVWTIPARQHGNLVVIRKSDDLFVRTSIDVEAVAPDLSGYATTESLNQVSESLSQSIAAITSSGGDYLPLAGGTITGNLKVNKSVGIGTEPKGDRCLAVGNGNNTNTNNAHYSVAIGENCSTDIYGGFVAGRENVVTGGGAFGTATGFRNRVLNMAGYAGGCRSTASANFATAIGFGAEARALGQVVLGSYNQYDPAGSGNSTGSYAVIFGIGKSSTWNQDNPGTITRQNGLAIKWDGGIDILYSGSTITLQDKIAQLEAGGGGTPISGSITIVTAINSSSTDDQVPSAKCMWDMIGDVSASLAALR